MPVESLMCRMPTSVGLGKGHMGGVAQVALNCRAASFCWSAEHVCPDKGGCIVSPRLLTVLQVTVCTFF